MGLIADAKSIAKRDPAAKNILTVILLYAGFHILIYHRIAHWLYRYHMHFLARLVSQIGRFWTGIEIHPGAQIGNGLFIDHGMGVVIGETAEIGDHCTIFHNVTLGGTGKDKGKRHPTLGNNVLIGAGAKLLGPFRVGDGASIGANAVVLHEVPNNGTVVGVPGKLVRQQGKVIDHNTLLDHDRMPDPMEQEICQLLHRVSQLEKGMSTVTGAEYTNPFMERASSLICAVPSSNQAPSTTSAPVQTTEK
ncbi:MAG: serine O-acetyltransferase [Eubacteriales bacterium]|nr:serine O-acetyltransferase [Eubacteriales bacterium]